MYLGHVARCYFTLPLATGNRIVRLVVAVIHLHPSYPSSPAYVSSPFVEVVVDRNVSLLTFPTQTTWGRGCTTEFPTSMAVLATDFGPFLAIHEAFTVGHVKLHETGSLSRGYLVYHPQSVRSLWRLISFFFSLCVPRLNLSTSRHLSFLLSKSVSVSICPLASVSLFLSPCYSRVSFLISPPMSSLAFGVWVFVSLSISVCASIYLSINLFSYPYVSLCLMYL